MCILPPKRGNQKIEFDLPARIGASNLQEIFNLHEKMRQELNISILEESFDQNTAQCKMAQQVKASSAKIVAHRGSKFEVDRCHQLSSPVISCQYFVIICYWKDQKLDDDVISCKKAMDGG